MFKRTDQVGVSVKKIEKITAPDVPLPVWRALETAMLPDPEPIRQR